MTNTRLGCLSPIGLIAALITLLAIVVSVAAQGGALFSPGPLNAQSGMLLGGVRTHAETSGECAACHTAPWDSTSMMDRCLDCHIQIQMEQADPAALHGALFQRSKDANCLGCHTEHNGPEAELTRVDIAGFPHDATGFSLAAHAMQSDGSRFTCEDCHAPPSNGRLFEPIGSQGCDDCHTQLDPLYMQTHRQAFAGACQNCHDGFDRFSSFDHNGLVFPLENAHAQLDCQACHQGQDSPAALAQTPQTCFACHAGDDQHQGAFGSECVLCHTTSDWQDIIFDHAASRFPLSGAHTDLACEACHQQRFRGTPLDCAACHQQPEYHAGLFANSCVDCHSTSAWQPADYPQAHSFPLDHEGAESCRDCHPTSLAVYTCYICHDQAEMLAEHRDEGISDLSSCATCHPDGTEDGGRDEDDDRDRDDDD